MDGPQTNGGAAGQAARGDEAEGEGIPAGADPRGGGD